MHQQIVLDYSFARPAPAAIVAAGAVGVCRYLSHDRDKRIDAGELAALHAAGLPVLLVWEDGARAAELGRPQGEQDARAANAQADALGWPDDRPIFYAVDYDVQGQTWPVMEYLRGAAGGGKRPVRVYGSFDVVEAAWHAQFGAGWQTLGWSRNRVSPHACLIQTVRTAPLTDTDVNVIGDGFATDWGQYPLAATVPPAAPAADPTQGALVDLLFVVDPANRDTELASFALLPWGVAKRITGGTPGAGAISHGGARQFRLTEDEAIALGWKLDASPAF